MTERMTATEAMTFEQGHSMTSGMILDAAAQSHGCVCKPYQDWFTYKRWRAQGFQVQKGQHGVKLTTYIPIRDDNDKPTGKTRPWRSTVFLSMPGQGEGSSPA